MADNKDKKVLNVPALRFPEFIKSWECSILEKLSKKIGDGIHSTPSYDDNGTFYFINGNNLNGGKIVITSSTKRVSEKEAYKNNAENLEANSILMSINGTIGNVALYHNEPIMLGKSACYINSKDNIDKNYLFYYLQYPKTQLYFEAELTGTTIKNLSLQSIRKTKIYIPTIEEQHKISRFLQKIDERISTQNKIIEKLETLIKGIVDSIFTANEFPKVPFKEIYVRAGEGGTPATSNPEYYDNGTIPFIKIDDLQNKYIKTNKDCITELGLQKSSAWIVPANSIIYSNGATIGAISINLFPVCTKQGILGVVPKADINVEFLYYFMTSTAFTKAVERIVTEGTMRTAYLKDINHIPCPVPCSVKQDEIAKLLSTLSEKLENEVIFQMKLQKQKEFLLSQMFI
ncbi:restriction endonuclease subunit S [Parabacteroides distasonis]